MAQLGVNGVCPAGVEEALVGFIAEDYFWIIDTAVLEMINMSAFTEWIEGAIALDFDGAAGDRQSLRAPVMSTRKRAIGAR